jgi:uncharacterized OB-fold protein
VNLASLGRLKQVVNAAAVVLPPSEHQIGALALTHNSPFQYICHNREYFSQDWLAMNRRNLPALERDTAFFWKAGAEGRLLISRCGACGRYQHPPLPHCPTCASDAVSPAPVSGRGRVATFTVNHQRWTAGLEVPFVFAAVELEEQSELYVFTNIIGCAVDEVRIGMPVSVCFERHDDVFLPMFQPGKSDG